MSPTRGAWAQAAGTRASSARVRVTILLRRMPPRSVALLKGPLNQDKRAAARVVAQHQAAELVAGIGSFQYRQLPGSFRVPHVAQGIPTVGPGGGLAMPIPGGV